MVDLLLSRAVAVLLLLLLPLLLLPEVAMTVNLLRRRRWLELELALLVLLLASVLVVSVVVPLEGIVEEVLHGHRRGLHCGLCGLIVIREKLCLDLVARSHDRHGFLGGGRGRDPVAARRR